MRRTGHLTTSAVRLRIRGDRTNSPDAKLGIWALACRVSGCELDAEYRIFLRRLHFLTAARKRVF